MNRNGFKSMTKVFALAASACCLTLAAMRAHAQTLGDVVSIYSDQANTIHTAAGAEVDIKVRLWGDFRLENLGGLPHLMPELRLLVNGDIAWAELHSLNLYDFSGIEKTEAVFRYRVRPGDMATPMRIHGNAGSGLPGDDFQFYWNGWAIQNFVTSSNAVWRFNQPLMGSGDVLDEDFSKANVVLRTLSFSDVHSPATVAATESVSWRVTTVNPVEAGKVVDFYVWSPSNNVRLGTNPGDPLLVSMAQGVTEVNFPVHGLTPGPAVVYLQRTADYNKNGTVGVTNYITRAINVTAAPDPTVSIRMKASGTDAATLYESRQLNSGSLFVDLSQPYAAPMTVRLDLSNFAPGETNINFSTSPRYITIPSGDTSSSEVFFNVLDGTAWSAGGGIVVTPVITNAAAAAVYTRTRLGTVYVQNVNPRIISPVDGETITVTRGVPHSFNWTVEDVNADMDDTMTLSWSFGDGTTTNTTGGIGSVLKSYMSNGAKTVKVTAKDKDGGVSDEVVFTVNVVPPEPRPSVRVVPEAYQYDETTTNITGSLMLYLSEAIVDDTYVRLDTIPGGQSNLVLSTTSAIRISAGQTQNVTQVRFSLRDGTELSEMNGIEIVPVVTNAAAAAHFTDLQSAVVYVMNRPPVVTLPVGGVEIGPIPSTVPYTFHYQVKDVVPDMDTMQVHWRFTAGGPVTTVTGAVGSVAHTYLVQGTHQVTVWAEDKDGGLSEEVEFTVVVGEPPTVSIITPGYELSETAGGGSMETIAVRLSTVYSEAVTVDLTVSPTNSPANGSLTLGSYSVTIPAGQIERTVSISNERDGTMVSRDTGFTITPTVAATPAAQTYFSNLEPGYVMIRNEAPYFISSTGDTDAIVDVPRTFNWSVSDVVADRSTLQVIWDWADGSSDTYTGANGSISHTYASAGIYIVRVTVRDKDQGSTDRTLTVTVRPAKALNVTPVGPNPVSYYGAGNSRRQSLAEGPATGGGVGYGTVSAYNPTPSGSNNMDNVYFYRYPFGASTARVVAHPYKTDLTGSYYVTSYNSAGVGNPTAIGPVKHDSFFLCWAGGGTSGGGESGDASEGLAALDLTPATASPTAFVTLPPGTTGEGMQDPEMRRIRAIFSLEWLQSDNLGDINGDGIPDIIATRILSRISEGEGEAGSAGNMGGTPPWLMKLDNFNDDLDEEGGTPVGDFYPKNPRGVGGRFDFRPTGEPFTAFLEVRGEHEGLNYKKGAEFISDPDGPEDEPGTDPTLADSDGDGMPDGWEHWFWRMANSDIAAFEEREPMSGEAYDPENPTEGILIAPQDIEMAFHPAIMAADWESRDFDNDGLTDLEELVLGTNPTHWDTDGDGVCDGWEILRDLDPCDPRDGALNPDGDYMAYALVPRQLVTVILNDGTTNMVLGAGAEIGETNGTFTTFYHYGRTNDYMAVGLPYALPDDAIVDEIEVVDALLLHFQVYHEFGFDPRTAWTDSVNRTPELRRFPTWVADAPNTRPFTTLDEYRLLKFMRTLRLDGAPALMLPAQDIWERYSTHPLTPDTDVTTKYQDGMPDGWELYMAIDSAKSDLSVAGNRIFQISPWNALDGALDHPETGQRDGLVNRREFAGTDSSAAYDDPDLYNMTNSLGSFVGNVSITFHEPDRVWINKFWPTNPWSPDTDGDGLNDLAERTFIYGNPADNNTTCIQGGGLNPNSVDTDLDGLPDAWEHQFAGTIPTESGPFSGMVITNGMDGTFKDHDQDWDRDGLLNYQEYWVQSIRGFRYDIPDEGVTAEDSITGTPGLPMDATFETSTLWTEVSNAWDVAQYPLGTGQPVFWFMPPVGFAKKYVSTDPRDHDTDKDGMDDYYELFHGLNPILGHGVRADGLDDRVAMAYIRGGFTIDHLNNDWGVGLPMDFVRYPWLAGKPEADPDADGLLNLEEKLQVDMAAPANYNTDPTPLWLTDYSSPHSLTRRFYAFGGMFFWPGNEAVVERLFLRDMSMFSFEMNEGFDTDNDGISDKVELMQSATVSSSPQDHDDPVRRQALWFDGVESAAQTVANDQRGRWALRSFTVELWAYPENVNKTGGQVLIERPVGYGPADVSDPDGRVRRNFRIGIEEDGRAYAMFENAGGHDEQTGYVRVHGRELLNNQWVHLAASMDGVNGSFTLYITHPRTSAEEPMTHDRYSVDTDLVPANGVQTVTEERGGESSMTRTFSIPAPIVMGAACLNPFYPLPALPWEAYDNFYRGFIDEVRVWDGARSEIEIFNDRGKRYNREHLLANRLAVRSAEHSGGSRVIGAAQPLPAEVLYHYTFDNLFSADNAGSAAKAPRGFNHPDVADNRPAGYEVGWLSMMDTHSDVYNDYGYITWIENSVGHLPIFSTKGLGSDGEYPHVDKVMNSVYWAHTAAGDYSKPDYGIFEFPNRNNPYGFWKRHQIEDEVVMDSADMAAHVSGDALPLGGAFALRPDTLWDADAPGSVWADTATDSDGDGLPDWWENYVETLFPGANLAWNDYYPDGSGMTAGERYLRDLAKGWTESNNPGAPGWNESALVPYSEDIDRDGLPDWWETIYNLKIENLLSADEAYHSEDGALGDPDRDGLSNYAEYLISEHYQFKQLNPVKFKSDPEQMTSDYFLKEGKLYYGQMFTDHDFMEDWWEDQFHPYYVSRFVYDAHLDNDEDGWSNWAECRYSLSREAVGPDNAAEYPIPVVDVTLAYHGTHKHGTYGIVVHAFTTPDMNGVPDAVFRVQQPDGWPGNIALQEPGSGYLKEGRNYLFAFLDLDGNGEWSVGEPCGLAEGFGFDVGWDRQSVNIELTDYTPGQLRIDLGSGVRSDDIYLGTASGDSGGSSSEGQGDARVLVNRLMVDGQNNFRTILDKTLVGNRNYLHEGDFLGDGQLALDWGLLGVANPQTSSTLVYEVRRYGDDEPLAVFTNMLDSARPRPVGTYPADAYVYTARPEFRWSMPEAYNGFAMEIKRSSPSGTTVYSVTSVPAPPRNANGECVWRPPIYANSTLPNGQVFAVNTVYHWRVMALSAKFPNTGTTSNWSDWKTFRLDVNDPINSSGYGQIKARVKYYGPATKYLTGRVRVQAFNNAGFSGLPEAEYTLAGADLTALTSTNPPTVNAVLNGLVPSSRQGKYYLRAYIDQNTNWVRDVWESWGYANYYGLTDTPYNPRPIEVPETATAETVDIVIEDCDTDQDWFPDAWEYDANPTAPGFLELTGPATGGAWDAEINPALSAVGPSMTAFFLTMATGTTDQDGDGLGDLMELLLGSDPSASSTAGDGFMDGDKVALGVAPNATLVLELKGLTMAGDHAPELAFEAGVAPAPGTASRFLPQLAGTGADHATCQVLYTESLDTPDWRVVQEEALPLEGVRALTIQLDEALLQGVINPDAGFFRIRLVK